MRRPCIRLQVSPTGVQWMGLMDDWSLYTVTTRSITVWNINIVTQFWAVTRSKAKVMRLHKAEGKSTRLAVQSEDGRFAMLINTWEPRPQFTVQSREFIVCV